MPSSFRCFGPLMRAGHDPLSLAGPASFCFLDAQHGWAVVRLASSSQFSWGHLYRTQDGGVTWGELSVPLGEPVAFANEQDGFQTGGPVGDAFFVTHDGGASWEAAQLPIPSEFAATYPVYGRPSFFSALQGVLPVIRSRAFDAGRLYHL